MIKKNSKKVVVPQIAKTILAGCYKYGRATLLRVGGATMTKVIEVKDGQETSKTNKRASESL